MSFAARLLACLILFTGASLRADNDFFAQAIDLNSVTLPYYGWVGGSGTAETGEPAHAGSPAVSSHWFKWTATATSACIVREFMNHSASRIAIYTGDTLTNLILVAQGTRRVFFPVTQGVTYHIAIDSLSSDLVHFEVYPPGGADDIAAAEPIIGNLPLRVRGNNALATAAPSDDDWHPDFHPTATVWWKWTAPASGKIRLDARNCDFGPRLTTYERIPGGSPVRGTVGYEAAGIHVTAGNEYLFCIDTTGDPGEVSFWLEWFPDAPPPNDDIANATDLGSALVACDGGWIFNATPQSGLPDEWIGYPQWNIPGDRTLWWKWTCPQSGPYRFSLNGSDGWPKVNVYTGSPDLLSLVVGTDSRNETTASVSAGTTYWIQVNDYRKTTTRAELNIHPAHTEPSYFNQFTFRGIFRLYGPQRHPDADPDGDGWSNQIEFACGSNPEVHAPNDPNLPHLLPHAGAWKLQWAEDTSYTTTYPGQPIILTGKVALSPAGPWVNATLSEDPDTRRKFILLPGGTRAFARLELYDPNWKTGP
jgi:hypothetical protein